MNHENWVQIVLGLLGVGLSITLTLLGILFSWLKGRMDRIEETTLENMRTHAQQNEDRFRSVYHELRDLRSQIDGLMKLLLQDKRKDK